MRYTFAIEQAIRAATVLHQGQVRKGNIPYPYVTHPYAVAMIVSDYVDDEATIVGALLHDTLGDTDYTEQEIEKDFGSEVRAIVVAVTEPAPDEKLSVKELQQKFFKQLKHAPEKAFIILAAEKIHNMRCIVEEYYDDTSRFLADFGSNLDGRLFYYQEMSNILNRALKSAILSEFNNVFNEYKNFIKHVKEKSETY